MNILIINKFLYPRGGDAISTLATGKLLIEKGHEVYYWGMNHPDNTEYPFKNYFVSYIDYNKRMGITGKLKAALRILYSFEAKKRLGELLKEIKVDIVHLNNFAHQISPSILHVTEKYKIPVVMTMHDYKMVCPSYLLMTPNLKPCERCSNGRYYNAFVYKCTKGSRFKSLINMLEMYLHNDILKLYKKINIYIAPSKFLKEKVTEMGLKGRVEHLYNFVYPEQFSPSYQWENREICYFGRLSKEKGIATLTEAIKDLDINLIIIGDGPERLSLETKVKKEDIRNVSFAGYLKGEKLYQTIKKCMFTVVPSEWYENNPRSVIESFALGKPVVGARIGGIPELVIDWQTGLTFESGNIYDLRDKIATLIENKEKIPELGRNARIFVEEKLNPEVHYNTLISIYRAAMEGG